MNCPAPEELFGWLQLHTDHTKDTQYREHLRECETCQRERERLEHVVQLISRPHAGALPEDQFTALALARATQAATQYRPLPLKISQSRVLWPALGLALALVLVPSSLAWWSNHTQEARQGFVPRGERSKATDKASVTGFLVRDGRLRLLADETIGEKDSLAFQWSNPTDAKQHLMIFAIDSADDVHWLFPAHVDAKLDPESVELAPRREAVAMDDLVAPQSPASGPLRIMAMITNEAQTVSLVENALRRGSAKSAVAQAFPRARIQEWKCSWLEKDAP